jgi:hypothetical protein
MEMETKFHALQNLILAVDELLLHTPATLPPKSPQYSLDRRDELRIRCVEFCAVLVALSNSSHPSMMNMVLGDP